MSYYRNSIHFSLMTRKYSTNTEAEAGGEKKERSEEGRNS